MKDDFVKNRSSVMLRVRRLAHRAFDAKPAPSFEVLKDGAAHPDWVIFFCYAPDNIISEDHFLTIGKLRSDKYRLLIVAAATDKAKMVDQLYGVCDALIVKDLHGYDFSGYAIGLRYVLDRAPVANIIVVNDSVLGPVGDLISVLENQDWELTGLTSCETREHHIQSYAFMLKNFTLKRLNKLKGIFPADISYSDYMAVVRMQESRFARVAARHMTVGSIWHDREDMTVFQPVQLLKSGFPFIKKSLFGKFKDFPSADDKKYLEDTYNRVANR